MRVAIAIVLVSLGLGTLSACGGGNSSGASVPSGASTKNGVPDADGNVPFEVFRRAVTAANGGDFAGAEKYVLPNSVMGTNEVGRNVLPEKWPPFTHNGKIASIDFIDDSYEGMEAYVHYKLHFADGSTFKERASFQKSDGRWKLTFMTETAPF